MSQSQSTLANSPLQDLKNVNRSVTPWVIVHGHRPAYATVVDTGSVIQAQDQRNAFEDIFVQYGVCFSALHIDNDTCSYYAAVDTIFGHGFIACKRTQQQLAAGDVVSVCARSGSGFCWAV